MYKYKHERDVAKGLNPLATEDTLEQIKNILSQQNHQVQVEVQSEKEVKPLPPFIKDVVMENITNHDFRIIKWMDKHGHLYANRTLDNSIYKSEDYGATWYELLQYPTEHNGEPVNTIDGLFVTDTGRIILGFHSQHVFVSDEEQTEFSLAFKFRAGTLQKHYCYSLYDNVVVLAPYGHSLDPENPAFHSVEVFLSLDYGGTFKRILDTENPVGVVNDTSQRMHIHDVEYDPYSKRIWVTTGDETNRQLFYTDNLGDTWNKIFDYPNNPDHPRAIQCTALLAVPDGLAMGSDSLPDGIRFWYRNQNIVQPTPKAEEFIWDHYTFDEKVAFEHIAFKPWTIRPHDQELYIMPFRVENNMAGPDARARLIASRDGVHWYEIYKYFGSRNDPGFQKVVGPHPEDPERRIFGQFSMESAIYHFEAKLPKYE